MAFLGDAGNTTEVNEDEMNQSRGYRLLEAGWYRAALAEDVAQIKPWGVGLKLQFTILTGDYENQRIFEYLCVQHTSEEAQHIARVKLRELAVAAGHKTPDDVQDTATMYGVPIMVEVYRAIEKEEKYADEDGKKARVGQFMSVTKWKAEHSDEPMPGVTKTAAKAAAPPPNNSPPAATDDIPF